MPKKRYRRRTRISNRKYGGEPTRAQLYKECKGLYETTLCPLTFFIVPVIHKPGRPLSAQEQRNVVRDALISGKYAASVGHVQPKKWTLIFFVRRLVTGAFIPPELRLISKLDSSTNRYIWVRPKE